MSNSDVDLLLDPHCPVKTWWHLAVKYPIEAMSSLLYPLLTLEHPGAWMQMERGTSRYWLVALLGTPRLTDQQKRLLAIDCAEIVLPELEAGLPPGEKRPRAAVEAAIQCAFGEITPSALQVARGHLHQVDLMHSRHITNRVQVCLSAADFDAALGAEMAADYLARRTSLSRYDDTRLDVNVWVWRRALDYLRAAPELPSPWDKRGAAVIGAIPSTPVERAISGDASWEDLEFILGEWPDVVFSSPALPLLALEDPERYKQLGYRFVEDFANRLIRCLNNDEDNLLPWLKTMPAASAMFLVSCLRGVAKSRSGNNLFYRLADRLEAQTKGRVGGKRKSRSPQELPPITPEELEAIAAKHPLKALRDPRASMAQLARWLDPNDPKNREQRIKALESNPAFTLFCLEDPSPKNPLLFALWSARFGCIYSPQGETYDDSRTVEDLVPWATAIVRQILETMRPRFYSPELVACFEEASKTTDVNDLNHIYHQVDDLDREMYEHYPDVSVISYLVKTFIRGLGTLYQRLPDLTAARRDLVQSVYYAANAYGSLYGGLLEWPEAKARTEFYADALAQLKAIPESRGSRAKKK